MVQKSDWRTILVAFAVGVAGAMQVGRIAPSADIILRDLQVDLSTIGWLVSLITLASAVLGLLAGHWVKRIGYKASLVIGALMMGAFAIVPALFPTVSILMSARVIEGLGYLIVVVAAPTLIAHKATTKDASFALALWGTFFTLGLSISAFAGGTLTQAFGWRVWFLGSAAIVLLSGIVAFAAITEVQDEATDSLDAWRTIKKLSAASWLLGAAFLGLTLLALSVLSLLPAFLVEAHSLTSSSSGTATGFVASASIIGSLCYSRLASRLTDRSITIGSCCMLVISVFVAFGESAAPLHAIAFAAVAVMMSGILVAQTFSSVPKVAGSIGLIGPTNGLVAQLGSLGALSGPPMIGNVVSQMSWNAVPPVVTCFTISFATLFVLALRFERNSLDPR